MPFRWARNVGVPGVLLAIPLVLQAYMAGNAKWLGLLFFPVGLTVLGGLSGFVASLALMRALKRGREAALRAVPLAAILGMMAVAGANALVGLVGVLASGTQGRILEEMVERPGRPVGFIAALLLIPVVVGFPISLFSRRGLRKALDLDTGDRVARRYMEELETADQETLKSEAGAAAEGDVQDAPASALSPPPLPSGPQPPPLPSTQRPPLLPPGHDGKHRRFNNFIARHWRGELSLPVSYWGISFLGAIVVAAVSALMAFLFDVDKGYEPRAIFFMLALVWATVVVVAVWQVVGTWRSAGTYSRQRRAMGRRTAWAVVARVMLVLTVIRAGVTFADTGIPQLRETYKMAFRGDPDMPAYALRVMRNGTEMEVSGGFKYGLTQDFEKVLAASPQVRVVHLTSVGGRLGEAAKLGEVIRAHGLDTYVSAHCESACTLAFVFGGRRWVAPDGKLGFHGPSFAGLRGAQLAASRQSMKADYVRAGIPTAFLDRALAVPGDDMWYPPLPELRMAKVITDVAARGQFAVSGYGMILTREKMATLLADSLPLYAALEARMPDAYGTLVDGFFEGYQSGLTQPELYHHLDEKVLPLLLAAKRTASDDVVVAYGRLALDQYLALQRDPARCYRFISQGAEEDGASAASLPPALKERALELAAQAVLSSAPRPEPDPKATDAAFRRVFAALRKQYGARVDVLEQSDVPAARQADYCAMVIAMQREILALQPAEAALLLRETQAQ
ncbi:hypothetical protein GCM10007301_02360 [Azorhizobium oxalatiphilum]|uniref:Uncharacterized protein n=2 Tax=Azorhizobium oxalatiphilum TaxID=980631 RepID=A0A917BK59_9HYPH|nr:hypothetical protein GCM10007301_02360 [Azorhizobium oxalatiphilum]